MCAWRTADINFLLFSFVDAQNDRTSRDKTSRSAEISLTKKHNLIHESLLGSV